MADKKYAVGLFSNYKGANKAVTKLIDEIGYEADDISIFGREVEISEYTTNTKNTEDVSDGAATGAAIGGIGGLLAGIGAITIPGIGPVITAGTLAAALGATALGAAGGGIIGALVDAGIPDDDAQYYAEGVKRGGILVAVKANGNTDEINEIFRKSGAVDIDNFRSELKEGDWEGFDEDTVPDAKYPSL